MSGQPKPLRVIGIGCVGIVTERMRGIISR
jgi:hypothetical protein